MRIFLARLSRTFFLTPSSLPDISLPEIQRKRSWTIKTVQILCQEIGLVRTEETINASTEEKATGRKIWLIAGHKMLTSISPYGQGPTSSLGKKAFSSDGMHKKAKRDVQMQGNCSRLPLAIKALKECLRTCGGQHTCSNIRIDRLGGLFNMTAPKIAIRR